MARLSLLPGFRRSRVEASGGSSAGGAASVPAPRRAVPPTAELRRERKVLLRLREEGIRDLGGLVLEMARQDAFRESLVLDRCGELLAIEDRLRELDALLQAGRPPAARCECGAPLFFGSHFCPHCGRSVAARPLVVCSRCGEALPAEARFCPACGQTAVVEGGTRTAGVGT